MKDLSESVIMPREDFYELSTVAFDNSHVPSATERVGQSIQTIAVFGALAGAVGAATWMCVKAQDWLETRRLKRMHAPEQFINDSQ
jgi:hypothetical protein